MSTKLKFKTTISNLVAPICFETNWVFITFWKSVRFGAYKIFHQSRREAENYRGEIPRKKDTWLRRIREDNTKTNINTFTAKDKHCLSTKHVPTAHKCCS